MQIKVGETSIELIKGDITELQVECIVNAANSMLKMGGGVAGAIRRKGGQKIQEECDKIVSERGPIPVGGAAITSGGNLKAKYVIHAVGPIYGEGDEERKLREATLNSLKLAEQHNISSIAFPAISTGHFGLPKKKCAEVMLPAAISYIKSGTNIKRIIFCLYDDETFNIFKEALENLQKYS
ncbi:MAG: O-acetyl-ADP-ribose deacetylase [Candidatus Methanomethylicota archaeon]|nr:MAG: O-acetyl-ADP-ribose deacetylase [Candidatus Verstraetearchaeota archaeon]